MSGKSPAQRAFLAVSAGPENPLIYLHTAEVTSSIPVAPTPKAAFATGVLGGFLGEPTRGLTRIWTRMTDGYEVKEVGWAPPWAMPQSVWQ